MDLGAIGTALIGQERIRAEAEADATWPLDAPEVDGGFAAPNAVRELGTRRSRRNQVVVSMRRLASAGLYAAAERVAVRAEEPCR